MTNKTLAQSYLLKATKRLKVLDVLFQEEAYSERFEETNVLITNDLKEYLQVFCIK